MPGPLELASERLNERKEALLGADYMQRGGLSSGNPFALLGGFDLEPEEVTDFYRSAATIFIQAAAKTRKPAETAAALWFEGLIFGLLVAEQRERER